MILVIDAKNERVAERYARYSAVPLVDSPLTLVLPRNCRGGPEGFPVEPSRGYARRVFISG